MEEMLDNDINPTSAAVWGPVGVAPAGSSIVWYGVHAFEMLERIMGMGAESVTVINDEKGHICTVAYPDGRRGIVELTRQVPKYGALIRNEAGDCLMCKSTGRVPIYVRLLRKVEAFFRGDESAAVPAAESLEIMKMLEAADLSSKTGKTVMLDTI